MNQTDFEVYEYSLNSLVEALNQNVKSQNSDVVIALSRKGPRLLEFLKREKSLHDFPVITEHALPFLFERLQQNEGLNVRLHIVDDAIYFGSTIASLKEEIDTYIRLYKLEDKVFVAGIYACIKDFGSMEFKNSKLFAVSNLRPGYGHYYVKQVMRNLRSLGSSLEVEFPSIKYTFCKNIEIKHLYELFRESFGDDKVYLINEPLGIKSLNVLLSDPKEASFRKLRIFVSGKELSIVSIAPELTLINLGLFKYVGFGNLFDVNKVWRAIAERLIRIAEDFDSQNIDKRNLVRTGVVLLNYFSSIDTYCYYRSKIEDILLKLLGYIQNRKLDKSNLYYLIGNDEDVEKIVSAWEGALGDTQYSTMPFDDSDSEEVDNVVFESSLMHGMVANSLKNNNLALLQNSETMEEALSAMFLNQNLLIERWSRFSGISKQERLRFGYTYQYLWKFIRENAVKLGQKNLSTALMHHWVDVQIDNGSIVPQYVLDKTIFQWVRVFRPGENEDLLVSHLGRLVVHVILQMNRRDEDKQIGKVFKQNLEGVLSAVYNHFRAELNAEELGCELSIDPKRHILYYNNAKEDSLVDYLVRMGILVIEDKLYVRLSSRVDGTEFAEFTTLSSQLVENIDAYIGEILDMMGNKPQCKVRYSSTINYFLLDLVSWDSLTATLTKMKTLLDDVVRILINAKSEDVDEDDLEKKVLGYYRTELSCYLVKESILLDLNSEISQDLLHTLWRVRKVFCAINIFTLITFYQDKESLSKYLSKIEPKVQEKLEFSDILDYLKSQDLLNPVLKNDKILLYKLIAYIYNI